MKPVIENRAARCDSGKCPNLPERSALCSGGVPDTAEPADAAAKRLQLVQLGQRLGLSSGELQDLLDVYAAGSAEGRDFPYFVKLLARYHHFVRWRGDHDRNAGDGPQARQMPGSTVQGADRAA